MIKYLLFKIPRKIVFEFTFNYTRHFKMICLFLNKSAFAQSQLFFGFLSVSRSYLIIGPNILLLEIPIYSIVLDSVVFHQRFLFCIKYSLSCTLHVKGENIKLTRII